jgi:CRP-like cAMP-binding protein
MDSIYDTILQMPLFSGMSKARLSEMIGKLKFHFLRFNDGETIANAGEECTYLTSVINGAVELITVGPNGNYQLSQTLEAPQFIAAEFLFGKTTVCPYMVKAVGKVNILQLDKNDCVSVIKSDRIAIYNYINYLSARAQLLYRGATAVTSDDTVKKIAHRIVALTQTNATNISLKLVSTNFARMFDDDEQKIDEALKLLQQHEILTYSDSEIKVINRRKLLDMLL